MSNAAEVRGARRRRIVHIRRTVVAISLAMFIALFAGLYVEMAAGRDPVLGSSRAATTSGASTGSTGKSATSSGSSATSPGNTAATPGAVTTSQS